MEQFQWAKIIICIYKQCLKNNHIRFLELVQKM